MIQNFVTEKSCFKAFVAEHAYFDPFQPIKTRGGHAEADDAEVCGLMRICAYAEAIRKTKSVCAIVGKKKQGQK